MEIDPTAEWRRLTEVYREKYDGELLELAADSGNLTETAQRVLRDEISRRRLSEPRPPEPRKVIDSFDAADRRQIEVAADKDADNDVEGPHDYTWKVLVCQCGEYDEAWRTYEVLRRAGIESWIEGHGTGVSVAADQIEEARAILAQPIPQDIVDESRMKAPEFEPPKCPQCGAEDPVLESADPVNAWECEQCGAQWTDAAEDASARA